MFSLSDEELINERWATMTDNGRSDSAVADVTHEFAKLRMTLRSRFNTSAMALDGLIHAERCAVHEAKRRIVTGGMRPRGYAPCAGTGEAP